MSRAISVGLDTSRSWTHAWQGSVLHAGDATVDGLGARYGLRLGPYYSFGPLIVLEPAALTNVVPVAAAFARVDGVRDAEPDGSVLNGDDITVRRTLFGWDVQFTRGFGDCPSGCIAHHHWLFSVNGSRVVFKGSGGDPIAVRP